MKESSKSLVQKVILSRQEFIESYTYLWRGEEAAQVLDSHDIFDGKGQTLRYQSEQMPLLSLLGLYTHTSGTLYSGMVSQSGNNTSFDAQLGRKEIPQALLRKWEENLGLTFCSRKQNYRFKKNGKAYARLLYLLGFSTSLEEERTRSTENSFNSKAKRGVQLPDYLSTLERNYDSLGNKEIARRYLRDLISVFALTKGFFSRASTHFYISLMTQPSQERLREEASQLFHAIQITFPILTTSLEDHFHQFKEQNYQERKRFSGILHFDPQHLACLSTPENYFPVKQVLTLSPKWSFEYQRS